MVTIKVAQMGLQTHSSSSSPRPGHRTITRMLNANRRMRSALQPSRLLRPGRTMTGRMRWAVAATSSFTRRGKVIMRDASMNYEDYVTLTMEELHPEWLRYIEVV